MTLTSAEQSDLVIRAPRVVTDGGEQPCAIGVRGERITLMAPFDAFLRGHRVVELGSDVVVLPGLVDSHVHVCEPGHADWEGFASATAAAAAGGITTIVDMPIDSVPVTTNVDALRSKQKAAEGRCRVDVGFWGGVVPGNLDRLPALHKAGVLGFKCFLTDAGTVDFPPIDRRGLDAALGVMRELGAPLLVHAESGEVQLPPVHGRRYSTFLASRPRGMENLAVAQVIEAARRAGARAHIAHLSSSDVVPMLASARNDGVEVTAETCPHYLTLRAEEVPDGATVYKCQPPVREADNRERLWQALEEGVLELVVSDHSPCVPEMKQLESGDFGASWGGISSLQLGLPLVWTVARRRGRPLTDVVGWMATAPARLAGLAGKGRIAPGFDADLCVFAPDESFVVDPEQLRHRNPLTPYAGRRLWGVVRRTMLRGRWIDPCGPPQGQFLTGKGL